MENFLELGKEFKDWLKVLAWYSEKKIKIFAFHFEATKGRLVDFLINKRGLRQRPFLHFGMLVLLGAGIIGAPFIASTYPTLKEKKAPQTSPSAVLNIQTAAETETVTEESVKPRDKIITHEVQKGETLSTIGEKYGVSIDTIRWANDLKSIHDISVGQELKILPVTGVAHTVKKGETVYTIAKKYEANPQAIVDFPFNDFIDPSVFSLAIGTTVIVPDGAMPQEKPWSPPTPALTIPQEMIAGGGGQLVWPAGGSISQRYVWYHKGLDIANSSAPGVGAAEAGRVTLVARERLAYGWHVIIDHGGGLQTLYAHLQRIDVSEGESVSRGQIIGRMGCTGRCTGIHLHLEVRKNGVALNPLGFLK